MGDWKAVGLLSIMVFAMAALPARSDEPGQIPKVPVLTGGEAELDACGSNGMVTGLNPAGDGFLAVRSGPGSNNAELDRLHNGEPVYICDQSGKWIGIVYTRYGGGCDVTSPLADRQPYTGPCKSGWVHQNWITLMAG